MVFFPLPYETVGKVATFLQIFNVVYLSILAVRRFVTGHIHPSLANRLAYPLWVALALAQYLNVNLTEIPVTGEICPYYVWYLSGLVPMVLALALSLPRWSPDASFGGTPWVRQYVPLMLLELFVCFLWAVTSPAFPGYPYRNTVKCNSYWQATQVGAMLFYTLFHKVVMGQVSRAQPLALQDAAGAWYPMPRRTIWLLNWLVGGLTFQMWLVLVHHLLDDLLPELHLVLTTLPITGICLGVLGVKCPSGVSTSLPPRRGSDSRTSPSPLGSAGLLDPCIEPVVYYLRQSTEPGVVGFDKFQEIKCFLDPHHLHFKVVDTGLSLSLPRANAQSMHMVPCRTEWFSASELGQWLLGTVLLGWLALVDSPTRGPDDVPPYRAQLTTPSGMSFELAAMDPEALLQLVLDVQMPVAAQASSPSLRSLSAELP